MEYLAFLTPILLAALLVLLLTGCTTSGTAPFATLTPSGVLALTETPGGEVPPDTAEPASTETEPPATPTSLPASPTPEPAAETPPAVTPPEQGIIGPDTAPDLQTAGEVAEADVQTFAWVASEQGEVELALATTSEVVIYEVDPETLRTAMEASGPTLLTASPDQQRLAWADGENQVHIWETQNGAQPLSVEAGDEALTSLAFSPDGSALAAASQSSLQIWDAASGELQVAWDLPSFLTDLTFSPDGTRLAGADPQNFTVYIFDRESGEVLATLTWEEHASPVLYNAVFSPDWTRIAWVARGTVQLMDVESGELGVVLSHEDFVSAVDWSPDSRLLVTTAAASVEGEFVPAAILWDAETGDQLRVLPLQAAATGVEFSPDGTHLAALQFGAGIQLWSVAP